MKALTIILGVLMSILGICAMAMPFRVFLGIGWLVGALFVIYGVQMAVGSLKKEKKDIFSCIFGVITVVLGAWITLSAVQRTLTDILIAYLVGFYLIIFGVLRCAAAYKLFKTKMKSQGVIAVILGILSCICGIFSVGHPIMTMISVGYIIAINLLVQGISMITMACMVKTEQ